MHLRRSILLAMVVGAAVGCTAMRHAEHEPSTAESHVRREAKPPAAESEGSERPTPAARGEAAATGQRADAVDPQAMQDVLSELQRVGTIDPATQAQLLADLRQTDPSLWPLMMKQFRAAIEYRRRAEAAEQAAREAGAGIPGGLAASLRSPAPSAASGGMGAMPPLRRAETTTAEMAAARQNGYAVARLPAVDRVPTASDRLGGETAAPMSSSSSSVIAAAYTQPATLRISAAQAAGAQISEMPTAAAVDSSDPRFAALPPPPMASSPAARASIGKLATSENANGDETAGRESDAATATAAAEPGDRSRDASPDSAVQRASAASGADRASATGAAASGADSQAAARAAAAALERRLNESKTTATSGAYARLRLMQLAAGDRDAALQPLPVGSPAEKEYWSKQVYALAALLDDKQTDEMLRAAEARRHLSEASAKLGESATLVVRNLAFCTEIQSYGCYKPFRGYEFTPDQEVLLYAEVENFSSEASSKGFHTSLKSSYQVFDGRGTRVAEREFATTEEDCQNARRDFFIGFHLRIPAQIYPGKHTLQLSIEDLHSHKIGQSTIEFTVKAK